LGLTIEFTGAPCCGKSTVSWLLAELISEQGTAVKKIPYTLSHEASKGKRAFVKGFRAAGYFIRYPKKSLIARRVGSSSGWWLNYLFVSSCHSNREINILEQGICQCIASLFEGRTTTRKELADTIDKLGIDGKNMLQVFIIADENEIAARAASRDDKSYYQDTGDTNGAICASIATNSMLAEVWEEKFGIDSCVIVRNADGDGKEAAWMIFGMLKGKRYL